MRGRRQACSPYTPPMRRSLLISSGLTVALMLSAAPARALLPDDVSLTSGPVSSVVSVSPDVYYDAMSSTYYLFTTGPGTGGPPTPGGPSIGVFTSIDGQAWTPATGASTPIGTFSDPSVIAMGDGTYRMYYAYRTGTGSGPGSACSGKQLRYATSSDLLRWTAQPDVLLGDLGCGVPNVVRVGEGDYRLYYVRGGEDFDHGTYMANSTDGLAWTPTDTLLTPTDMVDPSVVQLTDGSWLMLTADFPAGKSSGPFWQKLYAGTSTDGLKWDFGDETPLYAAPSSQGAFDPDAVVLPDGTIRVWWSQGTSPETALVTAGTVTVDADPTPSAPADLKVTGGKAGVKVTWVNPPGAPVPDTYVVQVKSSKAWKDVARVTGTSASVPWSKVGAKKGRSFSVRVVAYLDDASAKSETIRATRPR